jgi:hypothetical protein
MYHYIEDFACYKSFHERYNKHFQPYKYKTTYSPFAQHFQDNGHSFGPLQRIMDTLHNIKKQKFINSLENFYIYNESMKDK